MNKYGEVLHDINLLLDQKETNKLTKQHLRDK